MEDSITVTCLEEGDGLVCLTIKGFPYDKEALPTLWARSRGQVRREKDVDFVTLAKLLENGDIELKIFPNMAYAYKLGVEADVYLGIWTRLEHYVATYFCALIRAIHERLAAGEDWDTIIREQFPEREAEKAAQLKKVASILAKQKSGCFREPRTIEEELSNMEVTNMTILKTNDSETNELTVEARRLDPEQSPMGSLPADPPTDKDEKPRKERKLPPKKRPNSPRRVGGPYRSQPLPV